MYERRITRGSTVLTNNHIHLICGSTGAGIKAGGDCTGSVLHLCCQFKLAVMLTCTTFDLIPLFKKQCFACDANSPIRGPQSIQETIKVMRIHRLWMMFQSHP